MRIFQTEINGAQVVSRINRYGICTRCPSLTTLVYLDTGDTKKVIVHQSTSLGGGNTPKDLLIRPNTLKYAAIRENTSKIRPPIKSEAKSEGRTSAKVKKYGEKVVVVHQYVSISS